MPANRQVPASSRTAAGGLITALDWGRLWRDCGARTSSWTLTHSDEASELGSDRGHSDDRHTDRCRPGSSSSARRLTGSQTSHLSGRDSGLSDCVLDGAFERSPGAGDRGSVADLGWECGVELCEGWVEYPRVGLGEEDGQSASLAGQLVALGVSMAIEFSPTAATNFPTGGHQFLPAGGHESPHQQKCLFSVFSGVV